MGQKVSDETRIKAPAETVLEIITDIESYPEWAEGVEKVERMDSDAEGRPAKARFDVDAKVAKVHYVIEYAYEPNVVSWTLIEGETISQLDGSYVLTPDGDTTGVLYSLEADVDMPLPGFMKKRVAKQILEQGLKGLKARAEARA